MAPEPRRRALGDLACRSAPDWLHSGNAEGRESDFCASSFAAARTEAGAKTTMGDQSHDWPRHVKALSLRTWNGKREKRPPLPYPLLRRRRGGGLRSSQISITVNRNGADREFVRRRINCEKHCSIFLRKLLPGLFLG